MGGQAPPKKFHATVQVVVELEDEDMMGALARLSLLGTKQVYLHSNDSTQLSDRDGKYATFHPDVQVLQIKEMR